MPFHGHGLEDAAKMPEDLQRGAGARGVSIGEGVRPAGLKMGAEFPLTDIEAA
jgi:hypothetical protein